MYMANMREYKGAHVYIKHELCLYKHRAYYVHYRAACINGSARRIGWVRDLNIKLEVCIFG